MRLVKAQMQPARVSSGRTTKTVIDPAWEENRSKFYANLSRVTPSFEKSAPHKHELEYLVVLKAHEAWLLSGMDPDHLTREPLHAGELVCIEQGEWHCIEFSSGNGEIELMNFFGSFPPHIISSGMGLNSLSA